MFQLKILKKKTGKLLTTITVFFYFVSLSVFKAISWKSGHEGRKKIFVIDLIFEYIIP